LQTENKKPWDKINPSDLGFPQFPESSFELEGTACAYMPGMRVDKFDWYFVQMHSGNIRNYQKSGGNMSKALIHHLGYDQGLIDPLWGSESFKARVEKMKSLGVENVVAADFSSWADFPIVVQLNNYYKSMVVARDFVTAGFNVLPLVCWSAPQIANISIKAWPKEAPTIVIDACHIHTVAGSFNENLFWHGARMVGEMISPKKVYLWANSEAVAQKFARESNLPTIFVPSRSFVTGKFIKAKTKKRKDEQANG
jgi:hypothetical protein